MTGIYCITNNINDKKYIGSAKNIEKRWIRHLNDLKKNKHINIYLQRSWNKYTEKDFTISTICRCIESDLLITEQKYLDDIFSLDKPYEKYFNIGKQSSGGDNLTNHPNRESIIKKIKDNKKIYSKGERLLLSEKMMGENNPNYNNLWCDEQKNNMSIKLKKYYTENDNYIKNKTLEEYHGKDKADKIKKKFSEIASKRVGIKNHFYNKKHTTETKKIISDKKKGTKSLSQLKLFSINDITYLSLNDATIELNIPTTTIRHRIISKNEKFIDYKYITDKNIIHSKIEEFKSKLS